MASSRKSDLNNFSFQHIQNKIPPVMRERGNKSSTEVFPSPHKSREDFMLSAKLFLEQDFDSEVSKAMSILGKADAWALKIPKE